MAQVPMPNASTSSIIRHSMDSAPFASSRMPHGYRGDISTP